MLVCNLNASKQFHTLFCPITKIAHSNDKSNSWFYVISFFDCRIITRSSFITTGGTKSRLTTTNVSSIRPSYKNAKASLRFVYNGSWWCYWYWSKASFSSSRKGSSGSRAIWQFGRAHPMRYGDYADAWNSSHVQSGVFNRWVTKLVAWNFVTEKI